MELGDHPDLRLFVGTSRLGLDVAGGDRHLNEGFKECSAELRTGQTVRL